MDSGSPIPYAGPRLIVPAAPWRWIVSHRAALALAAITLAAMLLRLWNLSAKSLWIDETFSIGMVSQHWPSFAYTILFVQPNMEVFYLLLKLLASVTPAAWQQGEFFWRLLPALAGAACVPATFALARRLAPAHIALIAAAFVATNEFMVEYSQQARGYTLFVLIQILSWLMLVRWREGERRALAWFAALAALGFLTQAFETIFLLAQISFILIIALRRGTLPRWTALLALAPVGIIIVLRFPIYAAHPDQVAWIPRPTLSDLYHGMRQIVGGDGGEPSHIGALLLVLVFAGALILAVIALLGWRDVAKTPVAPLDRVEAALLALCWFAIPIAVTWVGSQVKPVWVTRYLAPCSIAAAVILALALHWGAEQLPAIQWRGVLISAATLLILTAALKPLHDYQVRPGWEDWRGAAQMVNANFQSGDGIVCYDNQWGCDFGFSHYFATFGGPAHLDPGAPGAFSWATYALPNREAIFAQAVAPAALAQYLAAHPRVWVLLGHFTSGVGNWQAGLAWLRANAHPMLQYIAAGDIEVYCFQRGGNPSK
jgi:mannosyltransferase